MNEAVKNITIHTGGHKSVVSLGESYKNLHNHLPSDNVIIITDENLFHYYEEFLSSFKSIIIGSGEKIKTMDTLAIIYERMAEMNADRTWFVVGFGGGIVCDIAGFAASTYMRGLPFGFVSTTLLSQVDASVGGKNGVNFKGFKNMIGVFNQPEFVICDYEQLKTLPKVDYTGGFAEIIKHAIIKDARMFGYLEQHITSAVEGNREAIHHLVSRSVEIKAAVVEEDEREHGERKKLNLGHTFGHSIEKLKGIPHGQAVSLGMVMAAKVSEKKGYITDSETNRIENLLLAAGLPVKPQFDPMELVETMAKDKKREGEKIKLILIKEIGEAIIETVQISELEEIAHDLR